jgi:hypothetical protein
MRPFGPEVVAGQAGDSIPDAWFQQSEGSSGVAAGRGRGWLGVLFWFAWTIGEAYSCALGAVAIAMAITPFIHIGGAVLDAVLPFVIPVLLGALVLGASGLGVTVACTLGLTNGVWRVAAGVGVALGWLAIGAMFESSFHAGLGVVPLMAAASGLSLLGQHAAVKWGLDRPPVVGR